MNTDDHARLLVHVRISVPQVVATHSGLCTRTRLWEVVQVRIVVKFSVTPPVLL
jgi:hypothetical protein